MKIEGIEINGVFVIPVEDIRPTDIIVLKCEERLSAQDAEQLKHAFEGYFPNKVLVISGKVELSVISPKESVSA